jgi:hypothetical protein
LSDEPPRPVSRSYSQLNAWGQCPRAYQLERVERVPRIPGWWFPGGSAVHAVIERYLRESFKENS